MRSLPSYAKDMIEVALLNCTRAALSVGDFFPIVEGVMLVEREGQPLGVRVYFEPPVKSVYWTVNGQVVVDAYAQEKKNQAPLDATFYVFNVKGGEVDLDMYGVYENSSAG